MGEARKDDTAGLTIARYVRVAGDSASRRRGLLGVSKIEHGAGLWIAPSEAIHTFGMKFAIDVVFLDRQFRIRKLVERLRPRRIAVCLSAASVLELRAGTIAECHLAVGDSLVFDRERDGYSVSLAVPISSSKCPSH